MKRHRKIKVKIVDERHLAEIGSFNLSWPRIIICLTGIALFFIFIGMCLLWLTPLKTNLPGYMKASQRSATEENLLRLDSLKGRYEKNQAYIDNFITVLNTERTPSDSIKYATAGMAGTVNDTLIGASEREEEFVKMMLEKEKFSLSVVAPLAADGVRFYPLNSEGVFTEESKDKKEGVVILPKGATINSIADGKVIEIVSPALNSNYTFVIQHSNGFLSKIKGGGRPLVREGENISGGQPISLLPVQGSKTNKITIELWHNGTTLIPYNYLTSELDYASM